MKLRDRYIGDLRERRRLEEKARASMLFKVKKALYPKSYVTSILFSPRIIQGMMIGHGLGVAYGHINAFSLLPTSKKTVLKACRANIPSWEEHCSI